jgi:hypothetical protein
MLQVFVRHSGKFVQLSLLITLSLCVGHTASAPRQSVGPTALAIPAPRALANPARQPTTIPDTKTQGATLESTEGESKHGSSIFTGGEPLLLLLFGLILFFAATLIKVKLSRVNRVSNQYFEPLVSQSAGQSETHS